MSCYCMSNDDMSFHMMWCNTILCNEVTIYVMSCCVMSCHVVSCHVMAWHGLSCYVMSCHSMAWHGMAWPVMLCHVMSCRFMACHVISCHVMLSLVGTACHGNLPALQLNTYGQVSAAWFTLSRGFDTNFEWKRTELVNFFQKKNVCSSLFIQKWSHLSGYEKLRDFWIFWG